MKLNLQLIILTLCIAIPTVVLITFFGIRSNRMQLSERLSQDQSDLQVSISQMDSSLELAKNSLLYLTIDNLEIQRIVDAKEQNAQFWMDHLTVKEKLEYQVSLIPLNLTPFIYYPSQDIFLNYETDAGITRYIKAALSASHDLFTFNNWQIIWISGHPYLILILDYQDYALGAFVSFDDLNSSLDSDANERYVYTDYTGKLLQSIPGESLNLNQDVTDYDDTTWYQLSTDSSQAGFALAKLIRKSYLDGQLSSIRLYLLVVIGIFLCMILLYSIFLNVWVMNPMKHLRKSMGVIQSGDLSHRISILPHASDEFSSVITEFNHLMDHIEDLKISMYEQELAQNEVRLSYLSRQIQPHFILNTLNTLYNYSEKDVETTREMIRLISQYYRYVVNIDSRYVRLGQELEHVDSYLRLQNLRYPDLFDYEITCPVELKDILLPPFILESFIGNSFKHGLIPGKKNRIAITIHQKKDESKEGGALSLQIEDDGSGFSEDSLDAIQDFIEHRIVSEELGVGIRNSIERLQLIYQNNCKVDIYNKSTGGAVVEITLFNLPLTGMRTD